MDNEEKNTHFGTAGYQPLGMDGAKRNVCDRQTNVRRRCQSMSESIEWWVFLLQTDTESSVL